MGKADTRGLEQSQPRALARSRVGDFREESPRLGRSRGVLAVLAGSPTHVFTERETLAASRIAPSTLRSTAQLTALALSLSCPYSLDTRGGSSGARPASWLLSITHATLGLGDSVEYIVRGSGFSRASWIRRQSALPALRRRDSSTRLSRLTAPATTSSCRALRRVLPSVSVTFHSVTNCDEKRIWIVGWRWFVFSLNALLYGKKACTESDELALCKCCINFVNYKKSKIHHLNNAYNNPTAWNS